MLTKKTILLHIRVAILKNIFDNFDTYLKISNAHVHRCKMFHLNSASYEFPFRCSFLICTWSFLLCYSPAGILSLLRNCANDIVHLFQYKYSILLKTVFLVSQHTSWLRLIRHKFTLFYQIFIIPAYEI